MYLRFLSYTLIQLTINEFEKSYFVIYGHLIFILYAFKTYNSTNRIFRGFIFF